MFGQAECTSVRFPTPSRSSRFRSQRGRRHSSRVRTRSSASLDEEDANEKKKKKKNRGKSERHRATTIERAYSKAARDFLNLPVIRNKFAFLVRRNDDRVFCAIESEGRSAIVNLVFGVREREYQKSTEEEGENESNHRSGGSRNRNFGDCVMRNRIFAYGYEPTVFDRAVIKVGASKLCVIQEDDDDHIEDDEEDDIMKDFTLIKIEDVTEFSTKAIERGAKESDDLVRATYGDKDGDDKFYPAALDIEKFFETCAAESVDDDPNKIRPHFSRSNNRNVAAALRDDSTGKITKICYNCNGGNKMLHAEVLLLLSERKLNNGKNNKSDDDENMALRITPHPSPSKKQTLLVSLQCCRMCAALASASQKALNLSEVIYLKKDLGPLALNTALQIQTTSTDENVVLRERQFSSLRCKKIGLLDLPHF